MARLTAVFFAVAGDTGVVGLLGDCGASSSESTDEEEPDDESHSDFGMG
jgi:hypothetical protein